MRTTMTTAEEQGKPTKPSLPPSYLPRSNWWRRTAVAPQPAAASTASGRRIQRRLQATIMEDHRLLCCSGELAVA
nr:hypothetical protein Itr_chr14CG27200 [Ipomoea trifida]GLL47944.1 hypothetical protein Itr_chr14CG27220 [Ipomoea trifida]